MTWLRQKQKDKGGVMISLYDSDTGAKVEYRFFLGEPVEMPKKHADFILRDKPDFEECEAPIIKAKPKQGKKIKGELNG